MSQILQIQATKLLDWIKGQSTLKNSELDVQAKSLIHALRVAGHLSEKQAEHAWVEPQGAWEFDLVHIESLGSWFAVNRQGQVTRY